MHPKRVISPDLSELPTEKRVFVRKAARSIAEIQQNVNDISDVVVLLEVLGYNSDTINKNGFETLYEIAKYVHNIIDYYDHANKNKREEMLKSFLVPIPSKKQRIIEILGQSSAFLGSLIVLYITGLSLWMAEKLSADVTIAFVAGVFLGLIFTEGPLQLFYRLFSFYYNQDNIGEVKRILKRNYVFVGVMLAVILVSLYIIAVFVNIPYELVNVTAISTVTLSLHRTSYMIIHALKKIKHLVISYLLAFAALLSVYFLVPETIILDITTRYLVALATSFVILSIFAIYHHYKILTRGSLSTLSAESVPDFYRIMTVNDRTIKSRFSVQFWDNFPYFIFGMLYFIMLFGDRILSWFFNPESAIAVNGTLLPIAFNSIYHIGADLALFVMIPPVITQYIIISPIYLLTNNKSVNLNVSEFKKIDQFLQNIYKKLLIASVIVSLVTAGTLNLIGPKLVSYLGGSEISIAVLHYASIGNILLSIFVANSMFMIYLNRAKILSVMAIGAVLVLAVGGAILAQSGFENISIAYLASSTLSATISTGYTAKIMRRPGNTVFARYV
jgi:hypothetical protein